MDSSTLWRCCWNTAPGSTALAAPSITAGYTPLGCAVSCRSIKGATWLLEKGQDPNKIKSKDNENCLHVAVHFGASDKMLKLLIDHGAEINRKDKQGRTPLARAHEKNRAKAIAFP